MTGQDLKNAVLQAAISGRLTEQLPADGSAADLYAQIQAKKSRLQAEGQLKKEKPLPPITEDDIPFDIPENWMWVRLNSVYNFIDYRGSTPEKLNYGIPLITAKNIKKGYLDYAVKDFISEDTYKERQSRGISHKGDILFTTEAPLGNVALADKEVYSVGQRAITLQQYTKTSLISNQFVLYFILSSSFNEMLLHEQSGTTVKGIKAEKLKIILIPLPPLAEQERIVARIEELFAEIDKYDVLQRELTALNAAFPGTLRDSILQAAIQGKLTEQLPSDGTAADLFREIQAEKSRLQSEGKLKKEKPLPPITEDDIPFDIPDNWMWVRWGDLAESIQYGYNAPAQTTGKIRMVRISDIQDGRVNWANVPYCEINDKDIETYLLKENDILFARTGGTVGKSFLVKEITVNSIYAGYLIRTRYSDKLCPEYLYYFMNCNLYWDQLKQGTTTTAQPNCNGKTLSKMLLPLPPLAEQKRIVERLETLFREIAAL